MVLEKAPEKKKGGNTWFSHGAQFRHVHNGIEDEKPLLPHISEGEWDKIDLPPYTKDDFYSDIMRVTRGKSVPELAELLVNESYPTVKWMREMGIQWEILYNLSKPDRGRTADFIRDSKLSLRSTRRPASGATWTTPKT